MKFVGVFNDFFLKKTRFFIGKFIINNFTVRNENVH